MPKCGGCSFAVGTYFQIVSRPPPPPPPPGLKATAPNYYVDHPLPVWQWLFEQKCPPHTSATLALGCGVKGFFISDSVNRNVTYIFSMSTGK